MRALLGLVLSLPLILSFPSVPALIAQSRTIAVRGVVTDASGGVLPGATVEAVVADRLAATATTDGDCWCRA